ASWGHWYWVWALLHEQNFITTQSGKLWLLAGYPLIPWLGVMALGYALGPIIKLEEAKRRRALYALGGGLTVAFFILRWTNWYGDPGPWQHYPSASTTIMSFFNTQQYPPSLLYLLMTIPAGIALLPVLEKVKNRVGDWVIVFGRVPMFYYVVHVAVVHAVAVSMALAFHRTAPWTPTWFFATTPTNFGFPLWIAYLVWI